MKVVKEVWRERQKIGRNRAEYGFRKRYGDRESE